MIDDWIHIPYNVCLTDRPACYMLNDTNQPCGLFEGEPDQGNETIIEAQLMDNNGKIIPLHHDSQQFTVSTIEIAITLTYQVWYVFILVFFGIM